MAWCPACGRYLTPTSLRVDGTCPLCDQVVDYKKARKADEAKAAGKPLEEAEDLPRVPWHLKLLLVATVVYLGYRAYQGIEWLSGRL